jgi:hypothetical protein
MLYNLYQLWRLYKIILHLHGFYIAYSFICWTIGTGYYYTSIILSYFIIKNPNEIKQIEDKKKKIK